MEKQTKICTLCKLDLPIADFSRYWNKKKTALLITPRCKKCTAKKTKEYVIKNPEKKKEYDRLYSINHREQCRNNSREWVKKHPDKKKQYANKYDKSEKGRENHRRCRERNKIKIRERAVKYRATNNKRLAQKKKTDVGFRLLCNLRSRFWCAIKLSGAIKQCSFDEYTGCSLEFLKKYLSEKFAEGMSWNNYGQGLGRWSIDHIISCDSFDFTKKEDQLRCFHYTNLQPMWWLDNILKGGKKNVA